MKLNLILALYATGFSAILLAYLFLIPRLQPQKKTYTNADGRLDFFTAGTGKLEDCLSYSFKVLVNHDRVSLPRPQVNLFHQQVLPSWMTAQKRGVLIAR